MNTVEVRSDREESIEVLVESPIPLGDNSWTYDCDTTVSDVSFVSRANTAASSTVPLYMDAFIPMMTMTSFLSSTEPSPKASPKTHPHTTTSVTLPGWESENYHYITCLAEENSENDVEVEIFKLALELEGTEAVLLKKSPTMCDSRARDELASAIKITRKASVHPNAPKFAVVPKPKRKAPVTTSCDIDLNPTTGKGSKFAAIDLVKIRSAHPTEPLSKIIEAVRVPLVKTTSTPMNKKNNLEPVPLRLSKMRSIHPLPKKEMSEGKKDRVPLEKTTSTPTNKNNDLEPTSLGISRMRSVHPQARKEISKGKRDRVPLEKTTSTKASQNKVLEPTQMSKSRTNAEGLNTSLSFDFEMKKERNGRYLERNKPPLHPSHQEMVENIEVVLDESPSVETAEDDKSYQTEEEEGVGQSEPVVATPPILIIEEREDQDAETEPETVSQPTLIVEEREDQDQVDGRKTSATEEYTRNEARKRSDANRPRYDLDEYLTSSPSSTGSEHVALDNGSMVTDSTEKASNVSGLFVPVKKAREDVIYFPIRQPKKKGKKKKKITMSSGLRKSADRKSVRTEKPKPRKEVVVRYATISRSKKQISERQVRMW